MCEDILDDFPSSGILAGMYSLHRQGGRVRITGDLKEEDTPSTSHLFALENDSSQTVASIDSGGNLYLKGRRYDADNH